MCFQLRDGFLKSQELFDGSSPRRSCDFKHSYQLPLPIMFVP
uniref:Uncharacterized protein n=1 Tax=Arundo donax TaxID=35708 RepID=A0A0A9DNQ8_ARUDO